LLDNSDLLVTELALGTMAVGEDLGWGAPRVCHDLGGDLAARRLAPEVDGSPQTQTAHESVERRKSYSEKTTVREVSNMNAPAPNEPSENANPRCAPIIMMAEQELSAFFQAVTGLLGAQQAKLSAKDWLQQLIEIRPLQPANGG
jgi:hypothetical protein